MKNTQKISKVKKSIIVSLIIGLGASCALAANDVGSNCEKAGKIISVGDAKLICAKSGKKLKWTIVSVATTTSAVATTTTAATTTTVAAATTTIATTTTTTTTTVAADKTPPVVTLLRGKGSSTSSTLTFTVTGDEPIKCSTLSANFDEDFTWDKISIIGSIVQTSTTVCTITAFSNAERDNDDHIATLRASASFSITDTAGNAQKMLLGSPQSTTVRRA
ncbi:MAG: hypothetical protein WCH63_05105 [Actinomycetota bacterium]